MYSVLGGQSIWTTEGEVTKFLHFFGSFQDKNTWKKNMAVGSQTVVLMS